MRFKLYSKKIMFFVFLFIAVLNFSAFGINEGINHITPTQGSDVILNEKVFGITVITGNNININADVDGTALIFGNGINVKSNINGDLLSFGNYIQIDGNVDGNSYLFGNNINLNGKITRDLFGFASSVSITDKAEVLRDAISFSRINDISGNIGRNITTFADSTNIKGTISGNAHVTGSMLIGDNAIIKGNLSQVNDREDKVSNGAQILGESKYTYMNFNGKDITMAQRITEFMRSFIFFVVLGIFIWLLVIFLNPLFIEKGVDLLERPLQTMGVGAIIIIATPIAALITFITIVGIPIGIIGLMVYGILIFLSKFLSSIFIANFVVKRFNLKRFHNNFWYVLGMLVIVGLLSELPYLNAVITIASICIAFGVIFFRNYKNSYVGI